MGDPQLIINLSNSCLILFIAIRFHTYSLLPSFKNTTQAQAQYNQGQSVSAPQQGEREVKLVVFPLLPVAVTSSQKTGCGRLTTWGTHE